MQTYKNFLLPSTVFLRDQEHFTDDETEAQKPKWLSHGQWCGLFSPFRVLASKSQAPSSYLFYICCKLKLPPLYSQYILVLMTQ